MQDGCVKMKNPWTNTPHKGLDWRFKTSTRHKGCYSLTTKKMLFDNAKQSCKNAKRSCENAKRPFVYVKRPFLCVKRPVMFGNTDCRCERVNTRCKYHAPVLSATCPFWTQHYCLFVWNGRFFVWNGRLFSETQTPVVLKSQFLVLKAIFLVFYCTRPLWMPHARCECHVPVLSAACPVLGDNPVHLIARNQNPLF